MHPISIVNKLNSIRMGSIKAVNNKGNNAPSTAGFPKAVKNTKSSNKSSVPTPPYKKGGSVKKGKMC